MDVFAHAFWTYAIFHKKRYRWPATLFGVLPDIISFGPFFLYMIITRTPFNRNSEAIPDYIYQSYNITHSLLIFSVTVLVFYLIIRSIPWPLLAWGIHIIIDIPTHTREFFPTPILWPISDINVSGISWGTPWFMIVNYSALVIVYGIIIYKYKKRNKN
ncbi:MAG TPA: hypothetical protein VJG30_00360 [Candidatus Nanoarchaeia archaeon]|nr:hypothetical protein [Candidatus Nanoarchaeia archaeon]